MRTFGIFSIMMLFLCSAAFALDVIWLPSYSVNPAAPSVGQVVTITATFRVNDGPVNNLRIVGGVDDTIIFDRTWTNIGFDAKKKVTFQWTAVAGKHLIFLQADPDSFLLKNNKNNRLEIPIAVSKEESQQNTPPIVIGVIAPILPDLKVHVSNVTDVGVDRFSMTFEVKNHTNSCVPLLKWKIISVENFNMTGEDLCATCPSYVFDATPPVCAIGPGEIKIFTVQIDKSMFRRNTPHYSVNPAYSYNAVYVFVDPYNDIAESNEANNYSLPMVLVWWGN
jgi:hypothetical protein